MATASSTQAGIKYFFFISSFLSLFQSYNTISISIYNPIPDLPEGALQDVIGSFIFLLGFALIKLGDKGAPVLNFFRAWTEAWKEITNIVLEFTPYGVMGLMANIVGKYGLDVLLPYAKTIGACYLTCALFTIFVQGGLMVGCYSKISPIKFFTVMKESILFVFATCSSVATIPLNLKCTKKLGVSEKIADFVIPFGAVMNMNGTAIYEAIAVVFASQVFGIHLSISQQIMVMVTYCAIALCSHVIFTVPHELSDLIS